jgi:hypothetical protein
MHLKPWTFNVTALAGWMNRQQQDAISYLREENRILREKMGCKRILLNTSQKRRLAVAAARLPCQMLRDVETLLCPDTSGDEVYTSGTWRQAHLARVESDDFTTHYMTSGLGIYSDDEALHIDETTIANDDGTVQVDLLLRHHAPHSGEQQITVKDASGSNLTLLFDRFGHFTGTM